MKYTDNWNIYFYKTDKNGNEIEGERGVHPKSYKCYGVAYKVALKTYPYRDGYRHIIAQRDPWQEYFRDVRCDICGTVHTVEESYNGYTHESDVYLKDENICNKRIYHKSYNHLCPDCITKILEFISSVEVKKDDF